MSSSSFVYRNRLIIFPASSEPEKSAAVAVDPVKSMQLLASNEPQSSAAPIADHVESMHLAQSSTGVTIDRGMCDI